MRHKRMQISSIALEIPALEKDQEGKLRGGFREVISASSNEAYSNGNCNCNCSCGSNGNCNCNCGCTSNDTQCSPSSSPASAIDVAYFMF